MRHIGRHEGRDEEQLAVIQKLEDDIIFRRFAPGTRLIEDVLMARYSASRHYVRQALAQMERQGIVQRVKNVGATVFAFTAEDIEQIFQVFGLLICHAVRAIPLPAPESLIGELERLNAIHIETYESGDIRAMRDSNDAFHCALLSACTNPYLHKTLQDYSALTSPMRAKAISHEHLRETYLNHHKEMIRLMATDDHEALAALCVEHLQPSKSDYLSYLASLSRGHAAGAKAS